MSSRPSLDSNASREVLAAKDAMIEELKKQLERAEDKLSDQLIKSAARSVSRRSSSVSNAGGASRRSSQALELGFMGGMGMNSRISPEDSESEDSDDSTTDRRGADSKSFSALVKKLGEAKHDRNGYAEAFEEVRKIASKVTIHDTPTAVAECLIETKKHGVLRRYTLETIDNISICLWQHFLMKGKVVVEYLLEITRVKDVANGGEIFLLDTIDTEDDLTLEAWNRLQDVKSNSRNCVPANLKECRIKLEPAELGQSILTMQGEMSVKQVRETMQSSLLKRVHASQITDQNLGQNLNIGATVKSFLTSKLPTTPKAGTDRSAKESRTSGRGIERSASRRMSSIELNRSNSGNSMRRMSSAINRTDTGKSMRRMSSIEMRMMAGQESKLDPQGQSLQKRFTNQLTSRRSNPNDIMYLCKSFKYIAINFKEKFDQPYVIDAKRMERFINEQIKHPPPLSTQEKALLRNVRKYEDVLQTATRLPTSLKGDVQNSIKKDADNFWSICSATIDVSAEKLLAHFMVQDTHAAEEEYRKINGDLPRQVWNGMDGSRSQQFFYCAKFSGQHKCRYFDLWRTWQKVEKTGQVAEWDNKYILAFAPISDYDGMKFRILDKMKFLRSGIASKAAQSGLYIISSVGPNVCRFLRVVKVDLQFFNKVPVGVLKKFYAGFASKTKEEFRRNPKVVDHEKREAIMEKMASSNPNLKLLVHQERIFRKLKGQFEFKAMKWYKFHHDIPGIVVEQTQILKFGLPVIRAKCTVDCSATEAAAWFFDPMNSKFESKNTDPVYLRVDNDDGIVNERTFAVVKQNKFSMFHPREFVDQRIWRVDEKEGGVKVAVWPVEGSETVDYGELFGNKIRCFSKAIFHAKDVEDRIGIGLNQCNVVLTQTLEGKNPSFSSVELFRKQIMDTIIQLREELLEDKDVDQANLNIAVRIIENSKDEYLKTENNMIDRGYDLFKTLQLAGMTLNHNWKSSDPNVASRYGVLGSGKEEHFVAVASANIDADLSSCLAYAYMFQSREKERSHDFEFLTTVFKEVNKHCCYLETKPKEAEFTDAVWISKAVWKRNLKTKSAILYWEDCKEKNLKTKETNASKHQAVMMLKKLPQQEGNVPQTWVKMYVNLAFKDGIIKQDIRSLAKYFLEVTSSMRKRFDSSQVIDARNISMIVARIKKTPVTAEVLNTTIFWANLIKPPGKKILLQDSYPLAETFICLKGKGNGWGSTSVIVRASVEEAAAYFWDFTSKERSSNTACDERIVVKEADANDRSKSWNRTVMRRYLIDGFGVQGRIRSKKRAFVNTLHLEVVDEDTIVIIMRPISDKQIRDDEGEGKEKLNHLTSKEIAREKSAIRLTRMNKTKTKVEFVTELELGKNASDSVTRHCLRRHLDEAAHVQLFFVYNTELQDMDDDLGEALGCDLVWDGGHTGGKAFRSKRHQHITATIERSKAFREVASKYPWIKAMLLRVIAGKIATTKTVETKLEALEEKQAIIIGNNLMPCLKSRKTPRAGVERWELQNRAIKELFIEFPWMRKTFISIGEGVVKAAPWGLFWRVLLGAAVSLADIGTDIVVAITFINENRKTYFYLTVGMIVGCIFLQSVLVIGQNFRRGFYITMQELLPVLTCFKPAIDAYRVASGTKMKSGNYFDPLTEMTYAKCIEMFAESIPGVLIQVTAIATAKSKESSNVVWASLIASAMTTGYTAATISFNYDTDPARREEDDNFYGYVPEDMVMSVIVFIAMSAFSGSMLLVRTTTLILLGLISVTYAAAFFSIDMFIFFFFKVARLDFAYWIPGSGLLNFFVSLIMRVVIKTIVDFTQIVHFRHPYELGGVYWCTGLLISLLALPVCQQIYIAEVGHDRVSTLTTRAIYILLPCAFLSFAVFFFTIKKGYWNTFINTQRGKDITIWAYHNAEDDRDKAMVVFTKSRKHWQSIEDEVRDWVESSWGGWVDEQPSWFRNAGIRANIPIEFIPNLNHRKLMRQRKRDQRRRSSFLARGRRSTGRNSSNGSVGGEIKGRRNSISKQLQNVGKTLAKTVTGTTRGAAINPAKNNSSGRRVTQEEEDSMNWLQNERSEGRETTDNDYYSSGRISNMSIRSRYSDF